MNYLRKPCIITTMTGNLESSELTKPIEQTKGEKLTDEQMGNLISAVGNNPAKAITLLVMTDGYIYSKGDCDKALLSYQGKNIGWKMAHSLPFDYCTHSLAPIGLVAKETLNPDLSTYGYQITDYGRRVGTPFCGLMLNWATKHDIPLNWLWGSTASPSRTTQIPDTNTGGKLEFKRRAPTTTLKIMHELITTPNLPIRQTDLKDRMNEDAINVFHNLERLAEVGLLNYLSIKANQPFSAYRLASSQPTSTLPIYRGTKSMTPVVLSILQNHPSSYLTIREIGSLLPPQLKNSSDNSHYPTISGILTHLTRLHYAETEHFHQDLRSEINLSGQQRMIITELLAIIDRFQDQEPEIITEGRMLAKKIINDPIQVSDILRRAKENSSHANKSPVAETLDLIRYLISIQPGITNEEIRELLNKEGKKLGHPRLRSLTALLEKENSVRVTRKGNVKKFFPQDPSIT